MKLAAILFHGIGSTKKDCAEKIIKDLKRNAGSVASLKIQRPLKAIDEYDYCKFTKDWT